jgi:hypothetical protein
MRRFTGNPVCGTKSAIFGRICVRIGALRLPRRRRDPPYWSPYGGASGAAEAVAEGRERRADCFRAAANELRERAFDRPHTP